MKTRCIALACACSAVLQAQAPVDRAWALLTAGASDESHEMRAHAIDALGLLANDQKGRAMAEKALTSDVHGAVRATAAEALGEMGAKQSIPLLIKAAHESDSAIVFAATGALYQLQDRNAYLVYYALLTGEKKSGEGLIDSQMKMLKDPKAVASMGLTAGIGFIPFGGISYKVFKMATADHVSPVRAMAAARLASDPDPKSGQALAKTTKDEKWLVRAAVAGAIARRNDPALLSAVIPLMDDENPTVRFNAAAAVIRLSSAQPQRRR